MLGLQFDNYYFQQMKNSYTLPGDFTSLPFLNQPINLGRNELTIKACSFNYND